MVLVAVLSNHEELKNGLSTCRGSIEECLQVILNSKEESRLWKFMDAFENEIKVLNYNREQDNRGKKQ